MRKLAHQRAPLRSAASQRTVLAHPCAMGGKTRLPAGGRQPGPTHTQVPWHKLGRCSPCNARPSFLHHPGQTRDSQATHTHTHTNTRISKSTPRLARRSFCRHASSKHLVTTPPVCKCAVTFQLPCLRAPKKGAGGCERTAAQQLSQSTCGMNTDTRQDGSCKDLLQVGACTAPKLSDEPPLRCTV